MTATVPERTPDDVLRATLVWGALATGVLAVIGGVAGFAVAGASGLVSALVGVVAAAAFLAITALSILAAQRFFGGPDRIAAYFGLVIAGWVVKVVVFVSLLLALRDQPWVQPLVFVAAVLASVLASLVVDLVAFARARVPYVGDVPLPTAVVDDDAAR